MCLNIVYKVFKLYENCLIPENAFKRDGRAF